MVGVEIIMADVDIIQGKVKGTKEVIEALNFMPETFLKRLHVWLQDEKGRFLGTRGYRGKVYKSGFRQSLAKKRLKRRDGTWAKQVAGLFSGKVPYATSIGRLKLTMGILPKKHQLKRAMEFLAEGGSITSAKEMPVPMYRNLAAIGYRGPFFGGNVHSGLTSKAFRKFASQNRLAPIKKGGVTYYFNNEADRNAKGKFNREDLLFMGVHGVTVRKTLTNRFDFERRFYAKKSKMIERGQKRVDLAARAVERAIKRG